MIDVAAMQAWVEAKDWRTWVSHVLMALVLAGAVFALTGVSWPMAAYIGVLGYWWREVEQIWDQWRHEGRAAVEAHAVDHFMDLAAPMVGVALLAWLWS